MVRFSSSKAVELDGTTNHIRQKLSEILTADARPTGLMLSIIMLIWGIVLLAPGDTFLISKVYAPMYYYFPSVASAEITWGASYLIFGLISLYCLFGTRSPITHYLLLPQIFLFIFTAIAFGRVSLIAIGPWLHGLFAIAAIWRFIRRSEDI